MRTLGAGSEGCGKIGERIVVGIGAQGASEQDSVLAARPVGENVFQPMAQAWRTGQGAIHHGLFQPVRIGIAAGRKGGREPLDQA